MESAEPVQGCVNMIRTHHAIFPYTKRISRTLQHFYSNRFHTDCYVFIIRIVFTKKLYSCETMIEPWEEKSETCFRRHYSLHVLQDRYLF